MSDTTIRVEGLGKRYHIGGQREQYRTLRDTLVDVLARPLNRIRHPGSTTSNTALIWALRDVSFEVRQGEVVGIIGRNGAGKTTLLKILSRITMPTEGRVEIQGRVGSLLEVGTGFHPELTGRENIYLNGAILGMKRAEINRKFDEIVEFAEIEKFLDTAVKRYSSGMYVRLAFAVAAHLEPEILLVDEVLAVGDTAFQKKCLGKMGDVAREGRTVLFVSHNLAVIRKVCPSAMVLEQGRIVKLGSVAAAIDCYLNAGVTLSGEMCFDGNGRKTAQGFRFLAARVLDSEGRPTSRVDLSTGFSLELEYEVLQPLRMANIGFHLWNNVGDCVLSSTDVDSDTARIEYQRVPGRYAALCYIPRDYLRAGTYHVHLSASIPRVRVLDYISNAISFDVEDTDSVESKLAQGREGVIAPTLPWTTRHLVQV